MLDEYRNIWIIGASSGIGRSLTEELDLSQRNLFVSARREKALEELASESRSNVVPVVFDMTDDGAVKSAVEKVSQTLEENKLGTLDMVIVNAGTCEYVDGPDIDLELVDRVMNTNFRGAVRVINAALPLLRKARSQGRTPKLVVMSSSVTYQALPRAHAYGASKAALRYFTECLKIDLQRENIDVHLVSPGFVRTPLTDVNDFPMPFRIESQDAAKRIVAGLEKNYFDISFPKRFIVFLKTLSNLPTRMRFAILGKMAREEGDQSSSRKSLQSTSLQSTALQRKPRQAGKHL